MTSVVHDHLRDLLDDPDPIPTGNVRVRDIGQGSDFMIGVDPVGSLMLLVPRDDEGQKVERFGRITLEEQEPREGGEGPGLLAVRCRRDAPRSAVVG